MRGSIDAATQSGYDDGVNAKETTMIRMTQNPIVMELVTDPDELAKAKAQDERFQRNWAWFEEHAADIYARHRGKCLCVAGQELFVGTTPQEALELAKAAHPEDDGFFTRYIPKTKAYRIYENRRFVVLVR